MKSPDNESNPLEALSEVKLEETDSEEDEGPSLLVPLTGFDLYMLHKYSRGK
jgi:hypothetical protein